jgi:hypothetical protein
MLSNHTYERLTALGLAGMAKAFDDQQRQPDVTALTFEQRLGLMIDREATERENKRLIVRLKFASLRQTAIVEDVELRAPLVRRISGNCVRPPKKTFATISPQSQI